jgi:hypothetical protein
MVCAGEMVVVYLHKKDVDSYGAWWCTPVTTATQEDEIRRIEVSGQPGQKMLRILHVTKYVSHGGPHLWPQLT